MNRPSPQKQAEWRARAARKNAIVPHYFEVYPSFVILHCGKCKKEFRRNLVLNIDEPVFVCPQQGCRARNWIPVKYDLQM